MRLDSAIWSTTSMTLKESKTISTKNWYRVVISHDGMTKGSENSVPYIDSSRRREILNWCKNHCINHWSEEGILRYTFEDEEDSVLFALTWI